MTTSECEKQLQAMKAQRAHWRQLYNEMKVDRDYWQERAEDSEDLHLLLSKDGILQMRNKYRQERNELSELVEWIFEELYKLALLRYNESETLVEELNATIEDFENRLNASGKPSPALHSTQNFLKEMQGYDRIINESEYNLVANVSGFKKADFASLFNQYAYQADRRTNLMVSHSHAQIAIHINEKNPREIANEIIAQVEQGESISLVLIERIMPVIQRETGMKKLHPNTVMRHLTLCQQRRVEFPNVEADYIAAELMGRDSTALDRPNKTLEALKRIAQNDGKMTESDD